MPQVVTELATEFVAEFSAINDPVLKEMEALADERQFPTVGANVGQSIHMLVQLSGAERAFEFGSGFGYSAYWLATALPAGGEITLTEYSDEKLEMARQFFERGGLAECANFERGDAVDIARSREEPVDIALIDLNKDQYPMALDAVMDLLVPGGLVVADNAITSGPINSYAVLDGLQGANLQNASDETYGVVKYLTRVRDDPDLDSWLIPLGEGIVVSRYDPTKEPIN